MYSVNDIIISNKKTIQRRKNSTSSFEYYDADLPVLTTTDNQYHSSTDSDGYSYWQDANNTQIGRTAYDYFFLVPTKDLDNSDLITPVNLLNKLIN
jgi:hypothetical protein